jgi:fructose-1,6-bisphosphatase/inositol monophosphatase family enzyme
LSDAGAPCEAYGVIDASLLADVAQALRGVARREILPRFGALSAGDIVEKAPGDLVTVADKAAERELGDLLRGFVPGSVVVGEEAVSADPGVLDALAGPDPVWIVDPIDGTANFVAGSARFSTLVALAQHGRLLASWTYAPVFDRLATASAGGGAFFDETQLRVRPWSGGLEHLPVVVPIPVWYSAETRARINSLSRTPVSLSYLDTSGLEYIEVAAGRRTAMVITWENVWDHAAGLLLVAEAGGVAVTRDGTGFRLSGGNPLPLFVAPDPETAAALHRALGLPQDSQNT